MKKIFLIGWKDLRLAFRDRAALILMLVAPFALTLGMGFVTGVFSDGSSGLSQIPVVLVNQDGGQLGQALVEVFQSPELADLIEPSLSSDPEAARRQVEDDEFAAAVIVPAGFTGSIIPSGQEMARGEVVTVQLYINPARPTSAGVIRSILESFLGRVEAGRAGGQVAVTRLIAEGLVQPDEAAQVGQAIGMRQAQAGEQPAITLRTLSSGNAPAELNVLAIVAPAMALMFLMYTTTHGGRVMLAERAEGTLPRLLISPTNGAQVLGGKVFGIFLTGAAQMLILIVGCSLLFRVRWGSPVGVLALVLAAVAGAVGWGLLITALAKTPGQVGGVGSAVMLIFGLLGGGFVDLSSAPGWLDALRWITPNAWGVEGFTILANGGSLPSISLPVAALLVMGAILFGLAVVLMNRQGFREK